MRPYATELSRKDKLGYGENNKKTSNIFSLNGPLGRIADRFDAGASDSGMDDLEIIDESNMAAIQQEMIEAGYSAQEIRDSMRNRLMR